MQKYGTARQVTENITRRMRYACWIKKATDTHSQYVILIAFLRERASTLRYTYSACLVSLVDLPSRDRKLQQERRVTVTPLL